MKKLTVILITLLLLVVLSSFILSACNSQDKPADNTFSIIGNWQISEIVSEKNGVVDRVKVDTDGTVMNDIFKFNSDCTYTSTSGDGTWKEEEKNIYSITSSLGDIKMQITDSETIKLIYSDTDYFILKKIPESH